MPVQCRIAPSLGSLEGHPNTVWGTVDYTNQDDAAVFFGLYGLPDFYALWRHKGKKYILWAGSDIRHFLNGYWLDEKGDIKVLPFDLARWINKYCESWVENEVERDLLLRLGVESQVCPSFMGNIDDYKISYEANGNYYASVSGNDFDLYRWGEIEKLAAKHPGTVFHLYGNTIEWATKNKNVIVHGRVSKEEMNEEVQYMQGGIRLLPMDGFSEVIAKSVLWGQWPVSAIEYPFVHSIDEIGSDFGPNVEGRNYYRKTLNAYPWNENYQATR